MTFFVLGNPRADDGSSTTDFIPADNVRLGDAPRCSVCGSYVGLRRLLAPIEVDVEAWGSSWGDIAFGPADQILLSEKCRRLFESAEISGIERIDVVTVRRVRARGGVIATSIPRYWLATIAHGTAIIDDKSSTVRRSQDRVCGECGLGGILYGLKNLVLKPGSWSGEDIFYARGLPGVILVSKRFKDVVEASRLTNFMFRNADDYDLAFDQVKS